MHQRKLGDGNMATTFTTERSVVLNINKNQFSDKKKFAPPPPEKPTIQSHISLAKIIENAINKVIIMSPILYIKNV